MTVGELIEHLSRFAPETNVHLTYNYGDYVRTTVAPAVSSVEEGSVRHSDYHGMPKVVDADRIRDTDEFEQDLSTVVLLG